MVGMDDLRKVTMTDEMRLNILSSSIVYMHLSTNG